jgi:hypothetical protein
LSYFVGDLRSKVRERHAAGFVSEAARETVTSLVFLVVEDEALVALDIITMFEAAGAQVVGSAGTAKKALNAIDTTSLDAALQPRLQAGAFPSFL